MKYSLKLKTKSGDWFVYVDRTVDIAIVALTWDLHRREKRGEHTPQSVEKEWFGDVLWRWYVGDAKGLWDLYETDLVRRIPKLAEFLHSTPRTATKVEDDVDVIVDREARTRSRRQAVADFAKEDPGVTEFFNDALRERCRRARDRRPTSQYATREEVERVRESMQGVAHEVVEARVLGRLNDLAARCKTLEAEVASLKVVPIRKPA